MTLPEIASELDNLIQRLQTARTLLASLGPEAELPLAPSAAPEQYRTRRRLSRQSALSTTAPSVESSTQPESSTPPVENSMFSVEQSTVFAEAPIQSPAQPPAPRPASTPRTHHRPVTTISASLAGKVPSGPVAVPAAEIRRRFTPAAPPTPVAEPAHGNSLDDLLRELAHRPFSNVAL